MFITHRHFRKVCRAVLPPVGIISVMGGGAVFYSWQFVAGKKSPCLTATINNDLNRTSQDINAYKKSRQRSEKYPHRSIIPIDKDTQNGCFILGVSTDEVTSGI